MERLKGRDMAAQRVLKQRMVELDRQKLSSTSAHDQDIRDLKRDLEVMQRRRSSSLQGSTKTVERRVSLTSPPQNSELSGTASISRGKETEVRSQRSHSVSTKGDFDEGDDLLQQMVRTLQTASIEEELPLPGRGESSKLLQMLETARSELEVVGSAAGSAPATARGHEVTGSGHLTDALQTELTKPRATQDHDDRHLAAADRRDSGVSGQANEVWSEVRKCRYIRGYDPPEMRMPKDIIGFVFAENQELVGDPDPNTSAAAK